MARHQTGSDDCWDRLAGERKENCLGQGFRGGGEAGVVRKDRRVNPSFSDTLLGWTFFLSSASST